MSASFASVEISSLHSLRRQLCRTGCSVSKRAGCSKVARANEDMSANVGTMGPAECEAAREGAKRLGSHDREGKGRQENFTSVTDLFPTSRRARICACSCAAIVSLHVCLTLEGPPTVAVVIRPSASPARDYFAPCLFQIHAYLILRARGKPSAVQSTCESSHNYYATAQKVSSSQKEQWRHHRRRMRLQGRKASFNRLLDSYNSVRNFCNLVDRLQKIYTISFSCKSFLSFRFS